MGRSLSLLSFEEAQSPLEVRSLMSTDAWLILRAVFDVCGIVGCLLALRCAFKHGYRMHV